MIKLTVREKIFFFISLLVFIFGVAQFGISIDIIYQPGDAPASTRSNSGTAIIVAYALAMMLGITGLEYTFLLTKPSVVNPRPTDSRNNRLHRYSVFVGFFSYLCATALLIIFVFVFVDEQEWISGSETVESTICFDAKRDCGRMKAQRWLLIPMWILGLTLAGLASVDCIIRSKNRPSEDVVVKQTYADLESHSSDSDSDIHASAPKDERVYKYGWMYGR